MTPLPTALDVYAAARRLAPHVRPTPLRASPWLSSVADATVLLKLESVQETGSFKVRGALNALLRIREAAERPRAPLVVTASAGNHGRAIALAAERLGMSAVVFVPRTAPDTKKAAIRRHGAVLRDECEDYDTAEREAVAFAQAEGGTYISPYNHPDVVAGAGTVAIEVLRDAPDVDTLVVPLGGGGLAAGMGLVFRAAAPAAAIVGVEVEASSPYTLSLEAGRIVEITPRATLADGLAGNIEAGSITFPLVQRTMTRVVTVSEDELARAMRGLAAEEHVIAEGAGAVAAAAVLAGRAGSPGARIAIVVSGANIDLAKFLYVVSV